jgi:hypothetical protein
MNLNAVRAHFEFGGRRGTGELSTKLTRLWPKYAKAKMRHINFTYEIQLTLRIFHLL